VRKRKARRKALGTRAPILVEASANARWSLDFVHDKFACGRRFRVLNVVGDVTRQCLAAIPDTSISGRRVARELTTLIERCGKPGTKPPQLPNPLHATKVPHAGRRNAHSRIVCTPSARFTFVLPARPTRR
jgi:transposase InsO family protein